MKYTTFLNHVKQGNIEGIEKGLNDGKTEINKYNNHIVSVAAQMCDVKTVALLINSKKLDFTCSDNEALFQACTLARLEVLKLLLSNKEIMGSIDSKWVLKSISDVEKQKMLLNAISIYHF